MHRPANVITWIMHNPLCSNIRNFWVSVPRPPSDMGWNYYLCGCRETISHIRMLKLIGRDAGDKEREQRQLFVTSFHLTGIIRYMKLKFLTGGSCWQHYFLFCSSPPFSFVLLFMLIWTQCIFPWPLKKKQHPPLKTALRFHSLHSLTCDARTQWGNFNISD